MWDQLDIAKRISLDIDDRWTINLGIGLPTAVAPVLGDRPVLVHSENGILGMKGPPVAGSEDPDLIHAGKGYTTIAPGGAIVDSAVSFTLIHSGRLDLTVMGAYQVSHDGDLANWRLPGRRVAAIGGAADLAVGATRVWVAMRLRTKDGEAKLVDSCSFPITARGCVSRVYTDVGVFERYEGSPFALVDVAPGVDPELVVRDTGCRLVTGDGQTLSR